MLNRNHAWHIRHTKKLREQRLNRIVRMSMYRKNGRGHFDPKRESVSMDMAKRMADHASQYKRSLWQSIKNFFSRIHSRLFVKSKDMGTQPNVVKI